MSPNPDHRDGLPFDGGAFYAHVVEAGLWRLPDGDDANLVGPVYRDSEACLPGICEPGSAVWYDPTLTPTHGNLVVVQWSEWVYQRIAAHHAKNGLQTPSRAAVKLLRNPDPTTAPPGIEAHASAWGAPWPDYLLVQSRGQMFLGDNQLIGMVRRIEQ